MIQSYNAHLIHVVRKFCGIKHPNGLHMTQLLFATKFKQHIATGCRIPTWKKITNNTTNNMDTCKYLGYSRSCNYWVVGHHTHSLYNHNCFRSVGSQVFVHKMGPDIDIY